MGLVFSDLDRQNLVFLDIFAKRPKYLVFIDEIKFTEPSAPQKPFYLCISSFISPTSLPEKPISDLFVYIFGDEILYFQEKLIIIHQIFHG